MNHDVTIVIRSVGERTETACRALAARQVPAANIVSVSNAPFTATLADSYRAGIEAGRRWTLCLDADVLLAPGAVDRLVEAASRMDDRVCEIQGLALDKFLGIRRPVGNHLYRTSLLGRALELIPPEGSAIRPELHTLSRMAESGYRWLEVPLLLGIHDFEQYDRDIFRKCYVYSRKFAAELPKLIEFWRARAPQDSDFHVALAGLAAGIVERRDVEVDVRLDTGFGEWMARQSRTEKPPLAPSEIDALDVEQTIANRPAPTASLRHNEAVYAREIVYSQPNPSPAHLVGGIRRPCTPIIGRLLGKAGRLGAISLPTSRS